MTDTLTMGVFMVGSSLSTLIVTKWFERSQRNAVTKKLQREADRMSMEGELKVTEFYKDQLEDLITKYTDIESKLNLEIIAHRVCQEQIDGLQAKYAELQKQFLLLKQQMDKNNNV